MTEKIVYEMPEFYKAELHKKCQNEKHKNTLIISFSSNEEIALYKIIKDFDALYFGCHPHIFYLASVEKICDFIQNLIIENSYTNIVLIGTSKGGFAGILYGILLSQKLKNISFNSLAFSPLSLLLPINKFFIDSFTNPIEYLSLLEISKNNNEILDNLKKFGNVKELLKEKVENLKIYAIAGENYLADKVEIERISHLEITRIFYLKLSSHFSLFPFIIENNFVENTRKLKKWLFMSIPSFFNIKDNEIELNKIADEIAELVKNGNLLSLNEIFGILADGNELVSLTKINKRIKNDKVGV